MKEGEKPVYTLRELPTLTTSYKNFMKKVFYLHYGICCYSKNSKNVKSFREVFCLKSIFQINLIHEDGNYSVDWERDHSFSSYAKFFEITNIFYSLIRTRTCGYQVIRSVSFSENFAYELNK